MTELDEHLSPGTMVFWTDERKPYWIIEYQPNNGPGAYWIVDAHGTWGVASIDELDATPSA